MKNKSKPDGGLGGEKTIMGITSSCASEAAHSLYCVRADSSRLPRGKMERALTPRLVTDLPRSRLAAQLSTANWQRPAGPQPCLHELQPQGTSARITVGCRCQRNAETPVIHFLIVDSFGRSVTHWQLQQACWAFICTACLSAQTNDTCTQNGHSSRPSPTLSPIG